MGNTRIETWQMPYTQMFLYLQVLDVCTTLIGFKLGLTEASPFIRSLLRFGPVLALLISKLVALVLAGVCIGLHKHHLIRWISYWYAGLIAWNLCTILAGAHCM
jgi:uncharacterized protein DUF5658